MFVVGIGSLVLVIMATIKASEKPYRYPVNIRFISRWALREAPVENFLPLREEVPRLASGNDPAPPTFYLPSEAVRATMAKKKGTGGDLVIVGSPAKARTIEGTWARASPCSAAMGMCATSPNAT